MAEPANKEQTATPPKAEKDPTTTAPAKAQDKELPEKELDKLSGGLLRLR